MTSSSSSNQSQYEDESLGYRPESTSTAFETTPEQRSERLYAFSEDSKKRVDRVCEVAELAGPRSIVTNTHLAIDYAHVIPRATLSVLLTSLEYAWGMKFGTLNIDTRYNVFCLNSDMHRLYDDGSWILVPKKRIVDAYKLGEEIPTYDATYYNYKLIPSCRLNKHPITRIQDSGPTIFEYPFSDFPILKSHVHPRYIIYNVGRHLAETITFLQYRDLLSTNREADLIVTDILLIYMKWIQPPPKTFTKNLPPLPNPGNDDNNNRVKTRSSTRTQLHRIDQVGLIHQYARQHQIEDSPSRTRKRCRKDNEGDYIDCETPRLQCDNSTPERAQKRKRVWVSNWVNNAYKPSLEEMEHLVRW